MSNYTKATNFLAKDSLASGDPLKIVRGSEIDAEFEAIETAVASKADSADVYTIASTYLAKAGGTMTGFITLHAAPTADLHAATKKYVDDRLPAGAIILWSGSVASIPAGWVLCNGSSGTPDLRDRFVVGAGSSYAVGASGGASSVSLTRSNLPYIGSTAGAAGADISVPIFSSTGSGDAHENRPPYYALCFIMKL